MKTAILIALLFLCSCESPQILSNSFPQVLSNKNLPQVSITAIPKNIDEFAKLCEKHNNSQGAVAMTILAMWIYAEDQDFGQKAMSIIVSPTQQNPGQKGVNGIQIRNIDLQRLKDRVRNKRYILQSYFKGTTAPQYDVTLPFTITTYTTPRSEQGQGSLKIMTNCNGADNARPVTVHNYNGRWVTKEWSSLMLGVRK
ncbi:hypothetical protein [Candidatus Uabimicrobium sp. HlEnr_7]|uniref:DUF6935 domain-containing protein n=1 Tax=Candidatus Uabimicrobium helgolandensis TaxID=3095367 RepID=UPI0035572DDA